MQYELQLPIHNENDKVDDFGYALVELDTEDVLVLLVEAPSGCTLDTFHLNDARSQLYLKFKKHPLSLNPRDVHKILVKNKVIPDEPGSERGLVRRLGMEKKLRSLIENSKNSASMTKQTMTIPLEKIVEVEDDEDIIHFSYTSPSTTKNPLQYTFVYFEFNLKKKEKAKKREEEPIKAKLMKFGGQSP